MTIKTFHQGKSQASDSELFGLVGRFLVDLKMHERLGTAITTNDGDIWLVSITGKGEVRGFATARKIKTSGLHIRFVYCPDDAPLMCKAMITNLLKLAEDEGCMAVFTNDKPNNPFWPEFGFSFTARARGTYGRWNKELGIKDATRI